MTDRISFLLNGTRHDVSGLPPTTTLLQYLRRQAQLTGTKEGCAEGDCGACTVAVGRLEGGKTVYRSINACIAFLPTLDGRAVVTVERLRDLCGGDMHPVQKAMVDCHASQCGFCTPGFVMALSTLMHQTTGQAAPAPDNDAIQDAIAGNLCRCTGYRPIADAARKACAQEACSFPDDATTLQALHRAEMMTYAAEGQTFFAPVTLDELARVAASHPQATLLSGGTDVGLWVTKMHRRLETVIYTGNVLDLRRIETTATGLRIGAGATYTEAFDALTTHAPELEDFLRRLGSLHIRNAGTIGGNIANGSPIGDGMPPLMALGARLKLRHGDAEREMPLEDFFIEYKKQDRQPGEFLSEIFVPARAQGLKFAAYKVSKRFDQDISAVCAGISFDMQGDVIAAARIAFGGMAGIPARAARAEAVLTGRQLDDATIDQAVAALSSDFSPMSDMRASAAYRLQAAEGLLRRFCLELRQPGVKTQVYRYAE